jgi:hypothetical protein
MHTGNATAPARNTTPRLTSFFIVFHSLKCRFECAAYAAAVRLGGEPWLAVGGYEGFIRSDYTRNAHLTDMG